MCSDNERDSSATFDKELDQAANINVANSIDMIKEVEAKHSG